MCCLIAKASLVVAGGTGKGLWGRPFGPGQPCLVQKMGRTTDDQNRPPQLLLDLLVTGWSCLVHHPLSWGSDQVVPQN